MSGILGERSDAGGIDFGQKQLVLRREPVLALRASWRSIAVLSALGLGAVVLAVLALGVGEYPVSPAEVVAVLTGSDTGFTSVVVLDWRMPRIVLALVIGAALGISGRSSRRSPATRWAVRMSSASDSVPTPAHSWRSPCSVAATT